MENDFALDGSRMPERDQVRRAADGGCERPVARTADEPPCDSETARNAADSNGGGCLSNTHPQSNTNPQSSQVDEWLLDNYHISGGLDWFEWSAHVEWNPVCFFDMVRDFDAIKIQCQERRVADQWIVIEDAGPVRVCRTGVNRGGDRGQHFEYRIIYRGVTIGIGNQQSAKESKRPNLLVRLTGRDCLLMGAREAYEIVNEFVNHLGATVDREKLSRADVCLDIAGLDIDELQVPVERRQIVTRAKLARPLRNAVDGKGTGFEVGKRPLRLIVYDKVEEQRAKADRLYLQALVDRRWGGKLPDKAVRVEYQLSRPWLREQGVNSPAEFFRALPSLSVKLVGDWFRITVANVDRKNKHQSRAVTLPIWEAVREAFLGYYGESDRQLLPIQRDNVEPTMLIKQARGCMANVMLQKGMKCDSYGMFVYLASTLFRSLVEKCPDEETKFMEQFRNRFTEHAA